MKQNLWFIIILSGFLLNTCGTPGQTSNKSKSKSDLETKLAGDTIRIVTWNTKDIFSLNDMANRSNDFLRFASTLKPDVILFQEFTSIDIAKAIRNSMDLVNYYLSVSNFVRSDSETRNAFEVGIISKYPLTDVTEFDPSPENEDEQGMIEKEIVPLTEYGIVQTGTSRGFLMAKIDEMDLYLIVLHLKSSLGRVGSADSANAVKRELVASYIAKIVIEVSEDNPNSNFLVAADFNVGHSDEKKNGTDLSEDCYDYRECDSNDLYDETHALLSVGLIDGLRMKNLTIDINETTYPGYPGSPIDNIYVLWKGKGKYTTAVRVNDAFGSDHVPIYVDLIY